VKSFVTNIALATLFAGAATCSCLTLASPMKLELNFQPGNSNSLFPAGSDAMRVYYDNGSTSRSITVAAGMFSGAAVEGNDTTINTATLFASPDNILAYCVDILKTLQDNAVYTLEEVAQTQVYTDGSGVARNFGRMLSFLGAVNQVQQTDHGFSADSKNWLRPNQPWMSGAIQLGIWESLYEKSGEDLTVRSAGNNDSQWFYADVSSNNVSWKVDAEGITFLDSVFDLINDDDRSVAPVSADEVLWAQNGGSQDLIIDPVDVPVPATGLLLLGGIGALAWRRRTDSG